MIGDTQFLNTVDNYQRQQYGQPSMVGTSSDPRVQGQSSAPIAPMPTTQQQGQNRLIGALVNPYDNMKSNWNRLTSDVADSSKPWYDRLGNGVVDTVALAKNPTGDWGASSFGANHVTKQAPEMNNDSYWGQPNANGLRPLNQTGRDAALQNAKINNTPIQDNSSVIHSAATRGHIVNAPQAQLQHGLIGRVVDSYINAQTGDALHLGELPQQAQGQDPNNIG